MSNSKYETPAELLYRCAFPRGRMLSKIEDDLSLFVQIIANNAHKKKDQFDQDFDKEYSKFHSVTPKTIHNYRTEMMRLFGLIFTDSDGFIEPTERTTNLVENQDFYLFFKIFCNKFQFPNCINKPQITSEQLKLKVQFKPARFIIKLLLAGESKYGRSFSVVGPEISNLVFNDLSVTTGVKSPEDCLTTLIQNRKNKIKYDGGSKLNQHGREFLGYMTLANLLKVSEDEKDFTLNHNEDVANDFILRNESLFKIPAEFQSSSEVRKLTYVEWDKWYGQITEQELDKLKTPVKQFEKLVEEKVPEETPEAAPAPLTSVLKDIGDLGEKIVLKFERDKIKAIRPDKVGLVQLVSNDTALGFDIQSLDFDDLSKKKLIEVKTTNRTYPPGIEILTSFPMSSNEWETARNYGDLYWIYRVFLVSNTFKIFVVKNPTDKEKQGLISLEPTTYRVILKHKCGVFV